MAVKLELWQRRPRATLQHLDEFGVNHKTGPRLATRAGTNRRRTRIQLASVPPLEERQGDGKVRAAIILRSH